VDRAARHADRVAGSDVHGVEIALQRAGGDGRAERLGRRARAHAQDHLCARLGIQDNPHLRLAQFVAFVGQCVFVIGVHLHR